MTPLSLTFRSAELRLVKLHGQLAARLDAGDESVLLLYLETTRTLIALAAQTAPGARGELLTTKELAARLNVGVKTVLRRRKRGELQALQLGRRGRAAFRWSVEAGR